MEAVADNQGQSIIQTDLYFNLPTTNQIDIIIDGEITGSMSFALAPTNNDKSRPQMTRAKKY